MITHFSNILHATWLGRSVAGGVPWLWPTFATLHFFGMALLIGSVSMIDLRLLGVARGLPVAAIQRLLPWGVLGFVVNLMTGVAFYAGNPEQYQTRAFVFKILCLLLAGANAIFYYGSGLHRRAASVGAGQDAPNAAKASALASLCLWCGVMFWGRMLTFFSNGF